MTEPVSKVDRSEMWKALKWIVILIVLLIVAFCGYKIWNVVTAPARVVGTATESMKSSASAVFNRLDIPIESQRRFDKSANAAFEHLNELPETDPDGVKDRGFRMANLRGAQSRVCELSYDFGNGPVPVFLAADNSAYEGAKAVGSKADRLIRLVIVSPEQTLGLNVEYSEGDKNWTLGWRPSSVKKAYPDTWAEKPTTDILRRTPKACSAQ